MLSLRAELTHDELGERMLPPSYIWTSRQAYGCEWLLWPEPTRLEEKQLRFLNKWPVPEDGYLLWENDSYIYRPSDIIAMLLIPYELFKLLVKPAPGKLHYDIRGLAGSRLFTPKAIRIMLEMMPAADEARIIYPAWLFKDERKPSWKNLESWG